MDLWVSPGFDTYQPLKPIGTCISWCTNGRSLFVMMVWVSLRYIIIFLVQSFQIKDRFCMVRTGRHPMSCSAYDFIILVEWHLLVLLVLPLPCLIVTLPINVYTGQVLSRSNSPLTINGTATVVTVLGLADVGIRIAEGYTPFYADDRDNYIDIIMHVLGDATVLESTLINVTAFSQQPGLYNPGGPGPFPFANVTYVAPAPEQTFRRFESYSWGNILYSYGQYYYFDKCYDLSGMGGW